MTTSNSRIGFYKALKSFKSPT